MTGLTKSEAREAAWSALTAPKTARLPFPTHGRIPDFEGADRAAEGLAAHPPGIDGAQLPAETLEAMPVLEQLRALKTRDRL